MFRSIPTSKFASRLAFSSSCRKYGSSSSGPRHLLSILDLSSRELNQLVTNAANFKTAIYSGTPAPDAVSKALMGKTVALIFSKRSTRTRISSEGAVTYLGGHPMFLGKDDIQLGVNESLYDSARVISSMTAAIFARVGAHSEVADLAKDSTSPVINALCDTYHPLQAIADIFTIKETFGENVNGLNLTWIGDANNVINDLAIAALKSGINVTIATPEGIEMSSHISSNAEHISKETGASYMVTHDPISAVKNANILVTDTFVSMGEEAQKAAKLKQFEGFQISSELATSGKADSNWKFMHCLPRHHEEVTDEVFYSDRSVVFQEAENRLYAAISVLDAFAVKNGKI